MNGQEKAGAQQVKGQVQHGGPPGVLGGPDGREQGGDTGADVLPHNQGDGHLEGHQIGRAHV